MNTATKLPDIVEVLRRDFDEIAFQATRAFRQETATGPLIAGERYDDLTDCARHLSYLIEALETQRPSIFERYVLWTQSLVDDGGSDAAVLNTALDCVSNAVDKVLGAPSAAPVIEIVERGIALLLADSPRKDATDEVELTQIAQDYLQLLLDGQRHDASQLMLNLAHDGNPLRDLYLGVFQPVQRELGRLWQLNHINVAQEHYCTAATQLVISQLYPLLPRGARVHRNLVVACPAGNLHELGSRMVADFFEMDGWDTYFVGSNTPLAGIMAVLHGHRADVLALSLSMVNQLNEVRRLVEVVKSAPDLSTKIMVGGGAFNNEVGLWQQIGADAFANDADAAVAEANALFDGNRPGTSV